MLSLDYGGLIAGSGSDSGIAAAEWMSAAAARYEERVGDSQLLEFEQNGARYLFDCAPAGGAERTVAAWALTPAAVAKRDASHQRGFPLAEPADGDPAVDRGHLIPHLSGGEFGPNIFRQDRALNRGWSD